MMQPNSLGEETGAIVGQTTKPQSAANMEVCKSMNGHHNEDDEYEEYKQQDSSDRDLWGTERRNTHSSLSSQDTIIEEVDDGDADEKEEEEEEEEERSARMAATSTSKGCREVVMDSVVYHDQIVYEDASIHQRNMEDRQQWGPVGRISDKQQQQQSIAHMCATVNETTTSPKTTATIPAKTLPTSSTKPSETTTATTDGNQSINQNVSATKTTTTTQTVQTKANLVVAHEAETQPSATSIPSSRSESPPNNMNNTTRIRLPKARDIVPSGLRKLRNITHSGSSSTEHTADASSFREVDVSTNINASIPKSPSSTELQECLERGIRYFNLNPKKGLKYLLETQAVPNYPNDTTRSAKAVAHFLRDTRGLNREQIGICLGMPDPQSLLVLKEYVDLHDFSGLGCTVQGVELGLRKLLACFRPPGEAQKIDRILMAFAAKFAKDNASGEVVMEAVVAACVDSPRTSPMGANGMRLNSPRIGYLGDLDTDAEMRASSGPQQTLIQSSGDVNRTGSLGKRRAHNTSFSQTRTVNSNSKSFDATSSSARSSSTSTQVSAILRSTSNSHRAFRKERRRSEGATSSHTRLAHEVAAAATAQAIAAQAAAQAHTAATSESSDDDTCKPSSDVIENPLSVDSIYMIAFIIILLNVDLHNANNPRRMSRKDFLRNCQGMPELETVPQEDLMQLYNNVSKFEIKHIDDRDDVSGTLFTNPDKCGWLLKKGPYNWSSWKYRWFILSANTLYYFKDCDDVKLRGFFPLDKVRVQSTSKSSLLSPVDSSWISQESSTAVAADGGGVKLDGSRLSLDTSDSQEEANMSNQVSSTRRGVGGSAESSSAKSSGGVVLGVVVNVDTKRDMNDNKQIGSSVSNGSGGPADEASENGINSDTDEDDTDDTDAVEQVCVVGDQGDNELDMLLPRNDGNGMSGKERLAYGNESIGRGIDYIGTVGGNGHTAESHNGHIAGGRNGSNSGGISSNMRDQRMMEGNGYVPHMPPSPQADQYRQINNKSSATMSKNRGAEGLKTASSRALLGGGGGGGGRNKNKHRRTVTGGIIFDHVPDTTEKTAGGMPHGNGRLHVTASNQDVDSRQGPRRFSRSQSFAMLKHMYVNLKGEVADGVQDTEKGDDRTTPLLSACRGVGHLSTMPEGEEHLVKSQPRRVMLKRALSSGAGGSSAAKWSPGHTLRSKVAVGRSYERRGSMFNIRSIQKAALGARVSSQEDDVIIPAPDDVELLNILGTGEGAAGVFAHEEGVGFCSKSRCLPHFFPEKYVFEIRSVDRTVKSVRYNKHGRLVLGQHTSVKLRSESAEDMLDWVRVLNYKGIVHAPLPPPPPSSHVV